MPETIDTPPVRWESLCPEVTDALLENITRRVVEAFAPVKVMLFGSYANGKPGPYSDVDLLVVMESTDPAAKRIVKVARVIPCLDVDAGRVVKGVHFVDIKDAGDPVELASAYDRAGGVHPREDPLVRPAPRPAQRAAGEGAAQADA